MRETLVVFSGGGTGGHLYPALAIADALRATRPDIRVVFIGAERGLEALVLPQRGEEHLLLPVQGIDRSRLLGSWRALTGLSVALVRVWGFFAGSRPEVVVVTGGYAGAAAGIVAGLMGVPLVLQEQNSMPGAVTRLLTRFATQVHVAFPEAIDRMPVGADRCVVSGNPVRAPSPLSRSEARASFGVSPDAILALVTGGSQGSLGLNRGVTSYVEGVSRGEFERPQALNLLWATGRSHFGGVQTTLRAIGEPEWVRALPYIEDVPGALVAADMAVSRAGAMTTAEQLSQGLPAILVPLPTSAEGHQMYNARALEAAGAATVLPEGELTGERLAQELIELTASPERLATMREKALGRARPHASVEIARDVATLLGPVRRAA
ncbi:MAG: UDP-N-acetylglucosamine--N-acetylmuramyl-(pentapeptide) pyrophosphoryl-undecaprenol N-acetylglucosamine transferase [Gemmatimonadetes bacterium]|nr:UDP-N-acetylglucosamine--N-acetylmuramyl-(pentapeptide) pyrophosphoryl-undecaprenol N-acetylglucosamine transferase [Gemmatimonadota bacterium]MDA1102820.1 UDP-N-acetylglucosamine--N-acetylmuramyl-(pentapeptide) pyrophosphoryl-undecaprenol N-acetylglucosamine transferase [Gemmatimonadota bacterium]